MTGQLHLGYFGAFWGLFWWVVVQALCKGATPGPASDKGQRAAVKIARRLRCAKGRSASCNTPNSGDRGRDDKSTVRHLDGPLSRDSCILRRSAINPRFLGSSSGSFGASFTLLFGVLIWSKPAPRGTHTLNQVPEGPVWGDCMTTGGASPASRSRPPQRAPARARAGVCASAPVSGTVFDSVCALSLAIRPFVCHLVSPEIGFV